jgi:hypothetical protein
MQGYFDRVLGFNYALLLMKMVLAASLKAIIINNTAEHTEFVYDAWPASKDLISADQ